MKAEADTVIMYTPNACTDFLAAPDGGLIRTLQSHFEELVNLHLTKNFDAWFSASKPNAAARRATMLKFLGETWEWFRTERKEMPFNVGRRIGSFFKLNDNRKKQFQYINWRGYETITLEGEVPKNPFEEVEFFEFKKELRQSCKKKRKLSAGEKGFAKRKKRTHQVQKKLQAKGELEEVNRCEALNPKEERVEFKDVVEEQQEMRMEEDSASGSSSSFDSDSEEVCGICKGKSPPGYKGVQIDWIACEGCSLWFHYSCVDCKNVDEKNDWFCAECDRVEFL